MFPIGVVIFDSDNLINIINRWKERENETKRTDKGLLYIWKKK